MKKITIIYHPQNEGLVLERIGQLGVIQFTEHLDSSFEQLRRVEKKIDYYKLYQHIHSQYINFSKIVPFQLQPVKPSIATLKKWSLNPDDEALSLASKLQTMMSQVNDLNEKIEGEGNAKKKIMELSSQVKEEIDVNEKKKLSLRAKIEYYNSLEPAERESCYAIGEVNNELLPQLEHYLTIYIDIEYKRIAISPQKSLLFIHGGQRIDWINTLFLVFQVTEISDVLTAVDKDLPMNSEALNNAINQYSREIKEIDEKIQEIRNDLKRVQSQFKGQIDAKIRESFTKDQMQVLGQIAYMDYFLQILSSDNIFRLRTDVVTIHQGWILDESIRRFVNEVRDLETMIDDQLFIQFDNPTINDLNVPTPRAKITPSFLQPVWTLTTLRGWPSAFEVTPHNLAIIIFSFQFALMFGDIGQGLLLLLLGIGITKKYHRGIMSKLGPLFVPMGVCTILFGFLYGEVFLVENLFPALLFRPLNNISEMMKVALGIAVVEMVLGLTVSMINKFKQRSPLDAFGEHGLGTILFLIGLFFAGLHFLEVGDIFQIFSYWAFLVMLSGLVLATFIPVVSAIMQKRVGVETLGEAVGALLMTFIESLANFFSFLRIAAFVLAHASLALAAHSLSAVLGSGGLIITNIVAMTFELMSVSVQSLRLLYYEFMGKFFQGEGSPFRPFVIIAPRLIRELQV